MKQPHRFDSLRERLLCAGVAPRHVERYLRELDEHYEDALRAELAHGAGLAASREAAWARLGTEDSLAQSAIDRPELRSTAVRFPAFVFGVVPVLTWLSVPVAVVSALHLLPEAAWRAAPPGLPGAIYALLLVYSRLVPVLLGAVALIAAGRRRMRARWPVAGAAVVDLLAGTAVVFAFPGQFGVSSSLLPWLVPSSGPQDVMALGQGLLRAACMLVLSLVAWRIAQRVGGSGLTPESG